MRSPTASRDQRDCHGSPSPLPSPSTARHRGRARCRPIGSPCRRPIGSPCRRPGRPPRGGPHGGRSQRGAAGRAAAVGHRPEGGDAGVLLMDRRRTGRATRSGPVDGGRVPPGRRPPGATGVTTAPLDRGRGLTPSRQSLATGLAPPPSRETGWTTLYWTTRTGRRLATTADVLPTDSHGAWNFAEPRGRKIVCRPGGGLLV